MANALETAKLQLQAKLYQSTAWKQYQTWYSALPARDQSIVKAIAWFVLFALIYLWVWVPAENFNTKATKALKSEIEIHTMMKDNAYKVSSNASGGQQASTSGQSVLAIVNSTSKRKGIELKRFEPEGESGIRIWLDQVKFNDVIGWIDSLENKHGIRVSQINIDKVESGIVNLRAVLKR